MWHLLFLLQSTSAVVWAAGQPVECPEVLAEQSLILTAAVEGWSLALESLDQGQSYRIRKVFSLPDDSVDRLCDRHLGPPGRTQPRVSISGHVVVERSYGAGKALSAEALAALRAALARRRSE